MSHFRRAGGGRRDANEPLIMKRFAARGWHCTQLSGTAIPDLLCFPPAHRTGWLVDVKMPGKRATEAQVNEWTSLSEKGIPVYVASTEADVDAIVGGTATPWGSEHPRGGKAKPQPGVAKASSPRNRCAADKCTLSRAKGSAYCATKHARRHVPPRSAPVDAPATSLGAEVMREMMKPPGEENYQAAVARSLRAAEQAADTFAPAHHNLSLRACTCLREQPCASCIGVSPSCAVPNCYQDMPCPRHSLSALGRP